MLLHCVAHSAIMCILLFVLYLTVPCCLTFDVLSHIAISHAVSGVMRCNACDDVWHVNMCGIVVLSYAQARHYNMLTYISYYNMCELFYMRTPIILAFHLFLSCF